jgi:hypothetical protein
LKIGPKSKKNRKPSESKSHLDFAVIFPLIFDEILINFDGKMEAALDGSVTEIVPYAQSN